jgi:hypothetical protein
MQSVTFTPTLQDLIKVYRLNLITSWKSWRVIRAYLIGAAVVGGAAALAAWQLKFAPVPLAALAGIAYWLAALTGIFISAYLQMPRRVRRIFDQQKALHDETVIAWSDNEIVVTSARGHARFEWRDFTSIIAGRHAILFRQSDAIFNFLPTRVLGRDQIDEILTFGGAPGQRIIDC